MRRAARIFSREAFRASCAASLLVACSVYQPDLLDGAGNPFTGGGSASSAGVGSRAGSANGGTSTSSSGSGTGGGGFPNGGTGAKHDGGDVGDGGEDSSAGSSGSAGEHQHGGAAGTGGGGQRPDGDLLDGFEDEDLTVEQTNGRGGVWYLFTDGSVGVVGPDPLVISPLQMAPAALGAFALHITASGFTGWGSGLGVDFKAGKKPYDASKFSGIRFWARVAEDKNTRHRLQLADATTDALGGKCNPALNAPEGEKCEDHFGKNFIFTTTWTPYVVRFEDLSQIGWGNAAPALEKASLYGLQLTAKAKADVDVWIDEIEFF